MNLSRAERSWGWLLTALGYEPFQTWEHGRSWRLSSTYIVVERSSDIIGNRQERRAPGTNHLAFHAGDRADVDRLFNESFEHAWSVMFKDRHPYAGGPDHYAAYLENGDGFEVELCASTIGGALKRLSPTSGPARDDVPEIEQREPEHAPEPQSKSGYAFTVQPQLTGRWRITEMELWDSVAIDLLGPAFIEINADGTGTFQFIAVEGNLDCRVNEPGTDNAVEFSWDGNDESDPASGRGWINLVSDGSLHGVARQLDGTFWGVCRQVDGTGVSPGS